MQKVDPMALLKLGAAMADLERFASRGGRPSKTEAEITLIRTILGLSEVHCPVAAVRVLYEEGREAFENMRAMSCADDSLRKG